MFAWCRATEHPRARGENYDFEYRHSDSDGTSPRTRGKRLSGKSPQPRAGNIPAHAGKTGGGGHGARRKQEHPRARGENVGWDHYEMEEYGTSPRTRGKRYGCGRWKNLLGNIPAHAGKTLRTTVRPVWWREHPRARGENSMATIYVDKQVGTSPRTRGKPTRFTPKSCCMREHPRARGENGCMPTRKPG